MASNGDAAAEPLTGDAAANTKPTATDSTDADTPAPFEENPFKIQVATWPEALPADEESHVMSIVCGNSHLHWALHNDARGEHLNPNLCECMRILLACARIAVAYLYDFHVLLYLWRQRKDTIMCAVSHIMLCPHIYLTPNKPQSNGSLENPSSNDRRSQCARPC